MQRVVDFLNKSDKTFKEGLEIYDAVKRSRDYDVLFRSAEHEPGSIAFNMLITELKNILRIKGVSAQPSTPPAGKVLPPITPGKTPTAPSGKGNTSLRIDDNPMIRVELLPEDMLAKYNRNKELVKLMAEKHAYLQDQSLDPVDAANAVQELEEMQEERDENWAAVDGWWKANREKLEQEKKITPMTKEEIGKQIKLISDNINRASKDLDTQRPGVQEKRKQRIAEWEKEREELKEKAKALKDASKPKAE